jgi:hypothetical protein
VLRLEDDRSSTRRSQSPAGESAVPRLALRLTSDQATLDEVTGSAQGAPVEGRVTLMMTSSPSVGNRWVPSTASLRRQVEQVPDRGEEVDTPFATFLGELGTLGVAMARVPV